MYLLQKFSKAQMYIGNDNIKWETYWDKNKFKEMKKKKKKKKKGNDLKIIKEVILNIL